MFKSIYLGIGLLALTAFSSATLAADGGTLQIFVSKNQQSLTVYDGGQIVATSKVSTGKSGHTTPSGVFSILEKRKYHESNLYSNAPMPWMQRITWSGVALHESNSVPSYPASHGCVRLPGAFARSLFQMTERGAHVIITDAPVAPQLISSRTLFTPELPADNSMLLSDAQLRPTNFDGSEIPVEVAVAEVLPKVGASTSVTLEKLPPLRILITRRGVREMVFDAQEILTDLGFDAGQPDGHIGPMTISAINGFKRWKGLPTKGEIMTAEFMRTLYHAGGRGEPPLGQIMVRQKFKPVFEAPITIDHPEKALGTHFAEATAVNRFSGKAEWHGVTLEDYISSATRKRLGITDDQASDSMAAALDRITIPDNIRHKIALLLDEGSSLTINDTGIGPETGQGTDFITITHRNPQG
ncbi:L,D-transpeptidase family protein [Agrobacterium sp. ES01]|uniref:L,D-transpeptidase family protein n=1 Tax=Agrobacterium sp. ES01 TaxID=3420714 RepID=UPI003D0D98E0